MTLIDCINANRPATTGINPPNRLKPFRDQDPATLLAMCCWAEARSQGQLGMLLVGQVVMNRLNDPNKRRHFGHRKGVRTGLVDIILQPWAFSCFNANDPNRLAMLEAANSKAWLAATYAAQDALLGRVADLTSGSTHYHTLAIHPSWINSPQMVYRITYRDHAFYEEIP